MKTSPQTTDFLETIEEMDFEESRVDRFSELRIAAADYQNNK